MRAAINDPKATAAPIAITKLATRNLTRIPTIQRAIMTMTKCSATLAKVNVAICPSDRRVIRLFTVEGVADDAAGVGASVPG